MLIAFGSIFIVLIILGIFSIVFIAVKSLALNKECKTYVNKVIPIILKDLRKETLFNYASEELINSARPEEMDKIFNWFKYLGKFKEYKDSKGEARISYKVKEGKSIIGHYVAQVEFETGPATVDILTTKKDNKWLIQRFRIDSAALIKE